MGLMDQLKMRKAMALQQKGLKDEAMQEYEKLYQAGVIQPAYLLPYTVLLLKRTAGCVRSSLLTPKISVPSLPAASTTVSL